MQATDCSIVRMTVTSDPSLGLRDGGFQQIPPVPEHCQHPMHETLATQSLGPLSL